MISLSDATLRLNAGEVGVLPTDTIYGLAARADNEDATRRLYSLKDRERKPGTLIAASVEQLEALGVSRSDLTQVAKWWPGPLSAVLVMSGREYLHQGLGDIAMRVVADPAVRRVLEQTGPLITSSANRPGEPSSTNLDEAKAYFGDRVDFYVDGGDLSGRAASTIIKPTPEGIKVLRQGAVDITL